MLSALRLWLKCLYSGTVAGWMLKLMHFGAFSTLARFTTLDLSLHVEMLRKSHIRVPTILHCESHSLSAASNYLNCIWQLY
jgi:hypothetical protein